MYGNCLSLFSAEKVFDRMSSRTIFTWNAMIGACVASGEPLRALELYRHMRLLGIPLDSCTFPCVLKACGMLKCLSSGVETHSLAIKSGYDSVVLVLNSLVAMYSKCNKLDSARQLFSSMNGMGDSVTWNSIISAYSANGLSMEALKLFREMQEAQHATNTYTYVATLQACGVSYFWKQGMEIHASILKSNHYPDTYVENALVGMYVRCGKLKQAVATFNRMSEKDSVSWNTMLSGFVQNGNYDETLSCFLDMLDAGRTPDQVAILNVLATCGRLGKLINGKEVHAYAIKHDLDSDLQVGNTLVDMYGRCYCVNFMGRAFGKMPNKDFISWTTVIVGYSLNNEHASAIEVFRKVLLEGVDVDTVMIGSILSSCSGLKCLSLIKEIHCYTVRRALFDHVLHNTFVDVYGDLGMVDYAKDIFKSIDHKDVVSWTSIISCCVHNGLPNEALEHFYCMIKSNIEPDFVSIVSILSAAASLSSLKKGKEIHGFVIRKGFTLSGSTGSSLVDMYSRCGNIENAQRVFRGIKNKNLILWTAMINANGMHGRGKAAIDTFDQMVNGEISPDHITFLALLYACSHSGLVDEGRRFLRIMKSNYQLEPWPEHYVCMVDLLARANCLKEAYQFVERLQMKSPAEVWCSLLRASWIHGDKEIAEIAARKLLELDLENPGNYVLVSNVFAACGRWKEVDEVRMKMKQSGLKKSPGCSWIEVGSKVHTFTARDKSHPCSNKIYQKLATITETLEREGGYVPQTKLVVHNVDEKEKVQMLYAHSERLAIAFALLETPQRSAIRITKNLRVCNDCHVFCKLVSKFFDRELIVRDTNRFHHFEGGVCSCGDFW